MFQVMVPDLKFQGLEDFDVRSKPNVKGWFVRLKSSRNVSILLVRETKAKPLALPC